MPQLRSIARLALILAATSAAASLDAATIQGRVLDPQRQPITGARVRVQEQDRELRREAASDATGAFTLPELPPGTYSLVAEAAGFASQTRRGLELAVGQTYRLDVALEIGSVAETVEAVASAPLLTAGSSTVDGVIGRSAIENLPLNGRNFMELAFLVPGNVPTPTFDPTKTNSVVVGSAGQLGRGGMVTIDGAENNDDAVGGPLQNVPQDAVQEFQIATGRFSAASGRSGASAINVITRSGTDKVDAI